MALSIFILAGGKSSRMGSDKAFLDLEGRSLLERALELARSLSGQVSIVGDRAKFATFAPVVEDVYSGHGPLAGIHAALASSQADCNLILGVDLPFLRGPLLKHIVDEAGRGDAIVTIPFVNGHYQTLSAVYRKEFSATAEAALRAGRNKIDALFGATSIHVIDEDELMRAGFDASAFRNLNTPEDWAQARRELGSQKQHV